MIEIKITDPHLLPNNVLRRTANLLLSFVSPEVGDDIYEDELPEMPAAAVPTEIHNEKQIIQPTMPNIPPPPPMMPITETAIPAPRAPEVWDKNIHARNKAKNADGTYKKKRGFVETSPSIPTPSAAPKPPIAPTTQTAGEVTQFPELMIYIEELVGAQGVDQAQIIKVVTDLGIPNIASIPSYPQLIPTIYNILLRAYGSSHG